MMINNNGINQVSTQFYRGVKNLKIKQLKDTKNITPVLDELAKVLPDEDRKVTTRRKIKLAQVLLSFKFAEKLAKIFGMSQEQIDAICINSIEKSLTKKIAEQNNLAFKKLEQAILQQNFNFKENCEKILGKQVSRQK